MTFIQGKQIRELIINNRYRLRNPAISCKRFLSAEIETQVLLGQRYVNIACSKLINLSGGGGTKGILEIA